MKKICAFALLDLHSAEGEPTRRGVCLNCLVTQNFPVVQITIHVFGGRESSQPFSNGASFPLLHQTDEDHRDTEHGRRDGHCGFDPSGDTCVQKTPQTHVLRNVHWSWVKQLEESGSHLLTKRDKRTPSKKSKLPEKVTLGFVWLIEAQVNFNA